MATTTYLKYYPDKRQLVCQGEWDLANIAALKKALTKTTFPSSGDITIDGKGITKLDTSGAWLLSQTLKKGLKTHLENFSEQHKKLLSIIQKEMGSLTEIPPPAASTPLATLGKYTTQLAAEVRDYCTFTGQVSIDALRVLKKPSHIRWNAVAGIIEKTGYYALPIIALLSFMIGVVIAYQMGIQLRSYGANIYIVDLMGLAVLREFGPLLTAIMVAGRTGAAFTAQLGTMKFNQEIDALNTMGVTPAELLILPRIVGLFIALPLLTIWADIFGILGGMVMSNNMLHITWYDFLSRFEAEIPTRALLIGLGKAPVFALLIASIGCFEGMRVEDNADSIGKQTTRSVVLAIFCIIIADAIFSIIFSKLKL